MAYVDFSFRRDVAIGLHERVNARPHLLEFSTGGRFRLFDGYGANHCVNLENTVYLSLRS